MSSAHKFFTFLDLVAIAGCTWLANYYFNIIHLARDGTEHINLYTGLSLFLLLLALPVLHAFVWFEKKYGLSQLNHKVINCSLVAVLVMLFIASFFVNHQIEKMLTAHGYKVCEIKHSTTGRFIDYSRKSTPCIK